MRFSYNHLTYEVPDGIDIVVEVTGDHYTADFNFVKDGEIIAMFGGTGNQGERLPTWEDVGITRVNEQTGGKDADAR